MKLKNLFLLLLTMAAVMTACSTDNQSQIDDYDLDGRDTDNISTYMSIRLIGEQGGTRTIEGSDGTQIGSNAENAINSALVFLTDATGQIKSTVTPKIEPTLNGATTQPFKVSEGTHYVYVIANPTEAMKGWTSNAINDKTITDITSKLMSDQYAGDGTFLMFNECNGTNDVQGKAITVTSINDINNPAGNDTPVKLDRLAAKITSTVKSADISDFVLKDITEAEMKGFVLLNGISKAYIQQHWKNEKTTAAPHKNTLITPDVTFSNFYATYEDYAKIEENSVEDLSKDDIWDKTPIYCMENNTEINGKPGLIGSSTGIIYRWQVTNANSDKLAGDNCFYSYNGEYFSTLKALQNAYPAVFNEGNIVSDDQDVRDEELQQATLLLQSSVAEFRAKYLVKVYEEGIMYYTFYIKDQNYVDDENKQYYSVMRNTIYGLNVTKLLKIGTDIPGGWEPEPEPGEEIDKKELYMIVKTEVNKWVLSNQDIELQ